MRSLVRFCSRQGVLRWGSGDEEGGISSGDCRHMVSCRHVPFDSADGAYYNGSDTFSGNVGVVLLFYISRPGWFWAAADSLPEGRRTILFHLDRKQGHPSGGRCQSADESILSRREPENPDQSSRRDKAANQPESAAFHGEAAMRLIFRPYGENICV